MATRDPGAYLYLADLAAKRGQIPATQPLHLAVHNTL
jgi:hypothetical protein